MGLDRKFRTGKSLFVLLSQLLLVVAEDLNNETEKPIVKIAEGLVEGSVLKSIQERDYFSFRGIPYGKAPVGKGRFRKATPAEPWSGVFDATRDGQLCPQRGDIDNNRVIGDEDCLIINVYTPQLAKSETKVLPVIIYIHGGGFLIGGSHSMIYGPARFMDHEVVLVTFNYRLGVLGFLSTDDAASPGNYGLHDQLLAIKWVHRNIKYFGGDDLRITLMGNSAGAVSVIAHVVSPLSQGLFLGAIAQSGSVLCDWAIQENPMLYARQLAAKLSCEVQNTTEMVECLRGKKTEELVYADVTSREYEGYFPLHFAPVVEKLGDERFLPSKPIDLFEAADFKRVPVVTGVNSAEGLQLFYAVLKKDGDAILSSSNKSAFYSTFLKRMLGLVLPHVDLTHPNLKDILAALKVKYFSGIKLAEQKELYKATVNLLSDGMHNACNDLTVKLLAKAGSPVYMYRFDHNGPCSMLDQTDQLKNDIPGVSHADELQFLFQSVYFKTDKLEESHADISEAMLTLWTNFAKFSKPVAAVVSEIHWPPLSSGKFQYLNVGGEQGIGMVEDDYLPERTRFWNYDIQKIIHSHLFNREKEEL